MTHAIDGSVAMGATNHAAWSRRRRRGPGASIGGVPVPRSGELASEQACALVAMKGRRLGDLQNIRPSSAHSPGYQGSATPWVSQR